MKQSDGKIGFRELISLIILIILIKGADTTPVNLFHDGQSATWMFPLIWYIVMIIPMLALLSILKKYKNKHLVEVIYMLTGKYIGFIINLGLFVILFGAIVLTSRNYVDVMNTMVFTQTPQVVLYGVLIGTSYFIANRGLEAIGRTSWLLFPYLVIGGLLLTVIVGDDFVSEHLYPIAGPGVVEVIKQGVYHTTLIGEFLLIGVFFTKVRDYKSYRNANLLGFAIACLGFSYLLAQYVMMFDYVAPQKMLHAFSQMTRMTEVGMFFSNLDALFFGLWMLTGIIRFSFYLYGCAALFSYTIKINEFEPLVLTFAVLTIIIGLIPSNPSQTILILTESILIKNTWPIIIALPILLWILSKRQGVPKK